MIFEGFTRPKARDFTVPADDVQLHLPGRMTGVFDGASDSLGRRVGGIPIGRLAASAAAQAAAALPAEAFHWPVAEILDHLSAAVSAQVPTESDHGPASTTAMLALEGDTGLRLIGIGDTGYRINGATACVPELTPDRFSIPARVALFRHCSNVGMTPKACEAAAQKYIGMGLAQAQSDGLVSAQVVEKIINNAVAAADSDTQRREARQFLLDGLRSQYKYANATQSTLGYGVLNGDTPDTRRATDLTLTGQLETLEIFSDGYILPAKNVTIRSWEKAHKKVETRDPHKVAKFKAVKGSTKDRFFDDRTIVILRQNHHKTEATRG